MALYFRGATRWNQALTRWQGTNTSRNSTPKKKLDLVLLDGKDDGDAPALTGGWAPAHLSVSRPCRSNGGAGRRGYASTGGPRL